MPSRSLAARSLRASLLPLVALVTPVALGAQSAADTVHACYVPLSGTIYRIRAAGTPGACTRPEHVAFRLAGPSSPTIAAAKGGPGGGDTTSTDHGTLAGLGDDDHPQYLPVNGTRASIDGFAVTATLGQGTIPATGAGSRFMWYPRKAALRTGRVSGAHWDDVNVGDMSFAAGDNAWAIGTASVALGREAYAGGTSAIAAGINTRAPGTYAVALGTQAEATGTQSVAVGPGARATAFNAVAVGLSVKASSQSFVFGMNSEASGHNSLAVGNQVQATGQVSTALGFAAHTNGKTGSVVIGSDANASDYIRAAADNQFVVRAQRMWLGSGNTATATANRFLETSTGAYLSTGGAWVSSSDSTKKHRWADVDGESVLARLAAMPVRTWSYRTEDDSVRHMGPTAQDFRAAFALGDAETSIASVDADGVSLAAAKALEQRTRELLRENAALAERLARVEAALAQLLAQRER